jgi:hypothetical protein
MDPASKKHLQPGVQSKGGFGSVKSLKDGTSNNGGGVDMIDSRPPHTVAIAHQQTSKYTSGMRRFLSNRTCTQTIITIIAFCLNKLDFSFCL